MDSRSSASLPVLTGAPICPVAPTGSLNLFVISNVIFLAVWFAYVGTGVKTAIGIQIVAFLALLFIDLRLSTRDVISATYFRVRTMATMIAVASLLVVLAQ